MGDIHVNSIVVAEMNRIIFRLCLLLYQAKWHEDECFNVQCPKSFKKSVLF
jgi:hypothetical protein